MEAWIDFQVGLMLPTAQRTFVAGLSVQALDAEDVLAGSQFDRLNNYSHTYGALLAEVFGDKLLCKKANLALDVHDLLLLVKPESTGMGRKHLNENVAIIIHALTQTNLFSARRFFCGDDRALHRSLERGKRI